MSREPIPPHSSQRAGGEAARLRKPAPEGALPRPADASPGPNVTLFFWLLLIATVVAMLVRRIRLPYAIALVVTGLAIGAPRLLPHAHLEPHTLFTVFLPPLLFEASIHLRAAALRRHWPAITIFALGGTLVSTAVIGLLAWPLLGLSLLTALVFGALISPTDPISVLAIFKRLGVGKRLSLLVEAESLFNDGVAVVLFSVLSAAAAGGTLSAGSAVQQFLVTVIGGAAVGCGIGWLASRVTHAFDDHLLEIMLTTVVAFGAYLGAEAVHVSGVIAVVAAGLVVGNYGMQSGMSPTTRLAVTSFWEYAAFAANSLVFLLLGIEVTVINLWAALGPVLIAILIVLAARAAAVYSLAPLAARWEETLPTAWRHVLVWGGLRGALSMALALGLPADFPQRGTLVVLTFGVVVFSLLVQGLTMGGLLKRLGLQEERSSAAEYQRLVGERLAGQAALAELDRLSEQGTLSRHIEEPLRAEYASRLEQVEAGAAALYGTDPQFQERQDAAARRRILLAQKAALFEAERNGLLDPDTVRTHVEELDEQIARLDHPV
jgi:CPA1 family monovalent cation:H+ antiporter